MLKHFLTTSCLALVASALAAQESPSDKQLLALVSNSMPSYWSVSDLTVVATSDLGDAVQPRRAFRFEADASPAAALFSGAGAEGPYALVVPTVQVDTVRRLYGVLDLSYKAGNWAGDTNIENPVTALGQPLDLFARPTLELGSDEAEQRLAALRNTALGEIVATQEAQLSRLRSEHALAMSELQAAQDTDLASLQTTNSSKLSVVQSSGAKKLAAAAAAASQKLTALELMYRNKLAQLTASNEPLVAEAKAAREKALAEQKAVAIAEMAAATAAAAQELDVLRGQHAQARGALIEAQRQELAEIETRLATEQRSLQRQLDTSQDVIALQQALLSALEDRNQGAEALLVKFQAARKIRHDFFARLPKNWSGQVRCISNDKTSLDVTSPITIQFRRFRADGVDAGTVTADFGASNDLDTTIVLQQEGISFPLHLRAQIDAGRYGLKTMPTNFDFTISQDGRMMADVDMTWTVQDKTVPGTCNFQLSS